MSREDRSILIIAFMLNLGVAIFLLWQTGAVTTDALARTANAYYVVNSRDPHLGAIGFVWNPLPSLLQIPLVVSRPLAKSGLAGSVISSIFGALSVVSLNNIFRHYGLKRGLRYILLLLFQLNPMILLYSANGMSEIILIYFLIFCSHRFLQWLQTGRLRYFILLSLGVSLALYVRYEAYLYAAALFVVLLVLMIKQPDFDAERMEGTLLTYLAPIAYAGMLWPFVNWLVMGDPFHFLRSVYANYAQTAVFRERVFRWPWLIDAIGSPIGTARYCLRMMAAEHLFFFIISFLILILLLRTRKVEYLALLASAYTTPFFASVMIFRGQSYAWFRFFIYVIPMSFILLGAFLRYFAALRPRGRVNWLYGASIFLILVSNVLTGLAMANPEYGREEHLLIDNLLWQTPIPDFDSIGTLKEEKEIANYIDTHHRGERILLDSARGFPIVLAVENPKDLIITSDRDYEAILLQPVGFADYFLIPSPDTPTGLKDSINQLYPDAWEEGAEFLSLEVDFGGNQGWRLFKVVDPLQEKEEEGT
ncbi:MAG: glycosyltransferase family 39 protein [Chloroflexi bacterium]|nr:glycosyltransferase family 39 protein [Chloroflexota bacterium]